MRSRLATLALLALLALLAAAPAAAQEEAPLDVDLGGGVTVRLLASGGSSWAVSGDATSGPASPFAAGGSVAVDLWNRERSFATRLELEGGAYGVALDAAGVLAFGDRWDDVKPYGFAGLSLSSMNGGGGVGAVLGLGIQVELAGPVSLCLEGRLHAGGGAEDEDGSSSDGAAGASVLAGLGFTF
jgi:opacity protein-like surface antigen